MRPVVLFNIVEPSYSCVVGMISTEASRQTKKGRTICIVHHPSINYPKMLSLVMRTVVVLVNGTMTQNVRESQASYTCELAKAAVTRWSGTRARMSNVFKII